VPNLIAKQHQPQEDSCFRDPSLAIAADRLTCDQLSQARTFWVIPYFGAVGSARGGGTSLLEFFLGQWVLSQDH
jgi:hypothetical protein